MQPPISLDKIISDLNGIISCRISCRGRKRGEEYRIYPISDNKI